ncbi:MAG: YdeI/OmpD-associated family protein [Candidatus Limiplasma sp.]|nr:YdeI/OmpD-associated family protein [Candidatus Limiplasma sp.]
MEQNGSFLGQNPEGLELPVGLGMQLAQEPAAMTHFGRLSPAQQQAVVHYVQSGVTGADAKSRVDEAVERLKNGDTHFFQ